MLRRRATRLALLLLRVVVCAVAVVLVAVVAGGLVLETSWGKERIRSLIVSQANKYLTAHIEIGRLDGSLWSGIELDDVALTQQGRTVIAIDTVSVNYSIRELVQPGVIVRRLVLVRPRVIAYTQADGRWNLADLVKRERTEQRRSGPGRPFHVMSVEALDGDITFENPLTLGAAHVPSRFERLNLALAFDYQPVSWTLQIANASWVAPAPDLSMNQLSGVLSHNAGGWSFDRMSVHTPQSTLLVSGRVNQQTAPAHLDLTVNAERFQFPEWGGVLHGLNVIAIDSSFDAHLSGPTTALATDLSLESNGGDVRGALELDTTVPGWRGKGTLTTDHLDLSRWLSRPDRPSDISGTIEFDLALELGHHFPHGSFTFMGPHAAFMGYAADQLNVRGDVTLTEARIAEGTAVAYGANVSFGSGSTIGLDAPFPFRFRGTASSVDLRTVPKNVPLPHVESTLAFSYDVTGRFSEPFIRGDAQFGNSEFLGTLIHEGAVGFIDTSVVPVAYTGEGDISRLDVHRMGAGLAVPWMQDPRYAGIVAGHFRVDGAGGEAATMRLDASGRLTEAEMFGGRLSDADVSVHIADGSLDGTYDGRLFRVDPAVATGDARFAATLTGNGRGQISVRGLLVKTTTLDDYEASGTADVEASTWKDVRIKRGAVTWALSAGKLRLDRLTVAGDQLEGSGSGELDFNTDGRSDFSYDITRADLQLAGEYAGRAMSGDLQTRGRMTGPFEALQLSGSGTVSRLDVAGVQALSTTADYTVTVPSGDFAHANASVMGRATFVDALGRQLNEAEGTASYGADRLTVDLHGTDAAGLNGALAGSFVLRPDRSEAQVERLTVGLGKVGWQVVDKNPPPVIAWNDRGIRVTNLVFANSASTDQRIAIAGSWSDDPAASLHVTATRVFLDTIEGALERPARYGGAITADVVLHKAAGSPVATGDVTITDGRIDRLSYQKLAGTIGYANGIFHIDARLDQAPGVWLTAVGDVPLGAIDPSQPERPMYVTVRSSPVGLGLIEGVTTIVNGVTGTLAVNVDVVGTSRDPHFTGTVAIADAGFVVPATGSRYRNGSAMLQLEEDRISVTQFHLEDRNGRTLDIHGSLGTHELKVGDLAIDVDARRFEVLHDDIGTTEVDAALQLRGKFEQPTLVGDITITGGTVRVDEILSRALVQPYSTEAASDGTALPAPVATPAPPNPAPPSAPLAAVAAPVLSRVMTPWERLALNITVHSRGTLRFVGENVQIAERTPLGLGSFNLRATGDIYLYKEASAPLSVTGWFDSITGSYDFQGRRFDLDPSSSVHFVGDVNPEVYVTVTRVISGVEARVSISGTLSEPELRLASTPPLDSSDILSLIVFNTTTNELSSAQQQELVVRTGTLAAGFLAAPLVSAIQRSLGLETLEIETTNFGVVNGPKVTVGEEIAPGLIARFSRQFGTTEYNEATIEYYLSRILRLRATFSDAAILASSPAGGYAQFHLTERAGIDLLAFFSF